MSNPNDWKSVPMPPRVAALPREGRRGFPIPYVNFAPNPDKVDFRVTHPAKRTLAVMRGLCGVCGQPLEGDAEVAFIGGPLAVENRIFSDPAMHVDCARYAAAVCPYLAVPTYTPSPKPPADAELDSMVAAGRPPKMALAITGGYRPAQIRMPDGGTHPVLYAFADEFISVEWF